MDLVAMGALEFIFQSILQRLLYSMHFRKKTFSYLDKQIKKM